jgi:hypothetical protein
MAVPANLSLSCRDQRIEKAIGAPFHGNRAAAAKVLGLEAKHLLKLMTLGIE